MSPKFVEIAAASRHEHLRLRLMTWNVLAQSLASRRMFPYAPKGALRATVRKPMLARQLRNLAPDILCLQEAEAPEEFWASTLTSLGYEFHHEFKSHAHTSAGDISKTPSHGLLIAWRRDQYIIHSRTRIQLNGSHEMCARDVTQSDGAAAADSKTECDAVTDTQLLPDPGNIGLVLEMTHVESDVRFILATTHLFWRPRASYIRLRQHLAIMDYLSSVNITGLPLVYCGDFNCTPESAEYHVLRKFPLTQEQMDELHSIPEPWNTYHGSPEAAVSWLLARHAEHKSWESAYSTYGNLDPQHAKAGLDAGGTASNAAAEPLWTNITPTFTATLDYILYRSPQVVAKSLLQVPRSTEIGEYIPSEKFPSDHVPLMAVLELFKHAASN